MTMTFIIKQFWIKKLIAVHEKKNLKVYLLPDITFTFGRCEIGF